jgi:hypothetical protein
MSYTAKQWSVTIRIIDVLAVAAFIVVGYLAWSLYIQSGKIRVPVSYSTPVYIILFFVIRGVAKKEKDKAEAAESQVTPTEEKKA